MNSVLSTALKMATASAVLMFAPIALADDSAPNAKTKSEEKQVIVVRHGEAGGHGAITIGGLHNGLASAAAEEPAKMVKAAFLGVGVSSAPEVLSEQLKLPQGVGLVVEFVEKGSPAEKAGIQAKDVIHKLDDQLLINPQQFATLIRTFKPGDGVKVMVIRKGEAQTLSASLIEKEMPELSANAQSFSFTTSGMSDAFAPSANIFATIPGVDLQSAVPPRVIRVMPGSTSRIIKVDDKGTRIELETRDGTKTLKVVDKDGKTAFEGPYNTQDEMDEVSPEYRDSVKDALKGIELKEVPDAPTTEPKAEASEIISGGPAT